MHRFWNVAIKDILTAWKPRHIVEIGSKDGKNSRNLVSFCREHGCKLTIVDTAPQFDINDLDPNLTIEIEVISDLSLNALNKIDSFDTVLLDGDHNYYTIFNELKMIEKNSNDRKSLVLLHDMNWPYARRDMYYNPSNIPDEFKHPYKKSRISPTSSELVEQQGINGHLNNSIYEEGGENGCLTAVEDFIDWSQNEYSFEVLDGFNGLGILCPLEEANQIYNSYSLNASIKKISKLLELDRNKLLISETILRDAKERLNLEKKKIIAKLKIINDENSLYLSQLESNDQLLNQQLKQISGLQNNLLNKLSIIEESNKKIYLLEKSINEMSVKFDVLHRSNDELSDEKALLKTENHSKSKKISELQNDLMNKLSFIEESNKKLFLLEKSISEINIQLQEQQVMYAELEYSNLVLKNKERVLEDSKNMYKTNLDSYKNLNNSIVKEVSKINVLAKEKNYNGILDSVYNIAQILCENSFLQEDFGEIKRKNKFSRYKFYISTFAREGIKAILKHKKNMLMLKETNYFDVEYYLVNNPDVFYSRISPYFHFLYYGGKEGRAPSLKFNSNAYFIENADVKKVGINPLIHYLRFGEKEFRNIIGNESNDFSENEIVHMTSDQNNDFGVTKKKVVDSILAKYEKIEDEPKVSIIITNRDGLEYLETLMRTLEEYTAYSNFDMIFVDNNSSDNSVEFVKNYDCRFERKFILNKVNKSFSEANNQATLISDADYYVFMNNDIEVTKGWLTQLMGCMQSNDRIGSVGPKLVYPNAPVGVNFKNALKIQQAGIRFREEEEFIRPYNNYQGESYNLMEACCEKSYPALTAACILISKEVFERIEGFDEGYNYGYEDVDLGLKIHSLDLINMYCPYSTVFHHEYGTQLKNSNDDVRNRRLSNIALFKGKWYKFLSEKIFNDRLNRSNFYTSKSYLTFGIVVTDVGPDVKAGDYFTGNELGISIEKLGHEVQYIKRRNNDWYNLNCNYDIVISLLDAFDINQLKCVKHNLIKIAWSRNWCDRWLKNQGYFNFDLFYASSDTARTFMQSDKPRSIGVYPIATNPKRFNMNETATKFEDVDVVFTGHYWGAHRDIIDNVEPAELDCKLAFYGKGWNEIAKFQQCHKGSVQYSDMPAVYKSAKIIIDDAVDVTAKYGSVNSRVFDALAAGKLVVTNGHKGANETFKGLLPTYSNKDELKEIIDYYLGDTTAYNEKVKELKEFVMTYHTYDIRASKLMSDLSEYVNGKKNTLIKTPVPKWDDKETWGDYHFAISLASSLRNQGVNANIQLLNTWDKLTDVYYDNIIVLRGLSKYKLKKYHTNSMWNLSHPDKVKIDEYNEYDKVFIASNYWAKHIAKESKSEVYPLLQCSDINRFHEHELEKNINVLYVGNSRNVYRKAVKYAIESKINLELYGTNWEKFINKDFISGVNIRNSELSKKYAQSNIVLNDHWDDMADKGFLSNRIFDVLASKTLILTDEVRGISDLFGDKLPVYHNKQELKQKTKFYLENFKERDEIVDELHKIVIEEHTFEDRAKFIAHKLNI